jgi:YVTN family beta-propeller protein
VGQTPRTLRVTPNGRHVFVINSTDTVISQIDTGTNTVIRSIKIRGAGATGLGFSHY